MTFGASHYPHSALDGLRPIALRVAQASLDLRGGGRTRLRLVNNGVAMRARAKRLLALLSLVLLAGSAPAGRVLPHDAYVWQRRWTPALTQALTDSAPLIRSWRVLAAQVDAGGRLRLIGLNRAALAASGRPVVLVVRLDSHLSRAAAATIPGQLRDLLLEWRGPIAGLEIDFDCATAALPFYGRMLADTRDQLPPSVPLSITALPTWLGSPHLQAVFEPVTEVVLQVHAVQNPKAGLFDPAQARRWIDTMNRRATRPFRVALPAYGARVTWTAGGRLVAVESERPLLAGGDDARELMADPMAVAGLVADLGRATPSRLTGFVWFRLPTDSDARAWSPGTWRAVLRGDHTLNEAALATEPAEMPGTSDLLLVNTSARDASLPATVALPDGCAHADGINGYARDGALLRRRQEGFLRPHDQRRIGWTRCQTLPQEASNAAP